MTSNEYKLRSIERFLKAGLSMGDLYVRQAQEEFEDTQHSCYNEGWAVGYRQAVEMIDKFVADTLRDEVGSGD